MIKIGQVQRQLRALLGQSVETDQEKYLQLEEECVPTISLGGKVLLGYMEYADGVLAILGREGDRSDQADLARRIRADQYPGPTRITARYELSCGAIVYRNGKKGREYLVIRAVKGHTGFPKGHREVGETLIQNAMREIKEETGLTPKIIPGFRRESHYVVDKTIEKRVIYFLAHQEDDQQVVLQKEEVAVGHFMPFHQAMSVLSYPRDRNILVGAESFIKKKEKNKA